MTTPTCVIDTTLRKITINNGFRIAYNIGPSVIPSYSFNMPGFLNPLTLDSTDSFRIYTKTSGNNIMDQIESGLKIKMTNVPYIKSVIVTPGSLVNSAITNYTFLITSAIPINSTYSVIVIYPTEITLPTDQS